MDERAVRIRESSDAALWYHPERSNPDVPDPSPDAPEICARRQPDAALTAACRAVQSCDEVTLPANRSAAVRLAGETRE